MSKLFQYGGIAASVVLIAFGIGSVVIGFNGRDRSATTSPASRSSARPTRRIPGQLVDTGSEAQAFAKVMRKHTLEATGGQTYAQMGQLPRQERQADQRREGRRDRPQDAASRSTTRCATCGSPRPR